jgi:16S rRNA (cytosine967-C5)-methyltransferase
MRLPGRISAAIAVLTEAETRQRPVAEALKAWGINNRFAGAGDRAAIGNLVYDALRRRASHAALMGSDSARALVLSVVVRDWGEDPAALNESFSGDRHAPEALSAEEMARVVGQLPDDTPGWVLADSPQWLAPSLQRAFGDNWIAEGQDMAGRPSLDLRVNSLRAERTKAMQALARFDPKETAIAPLGLTMPARPRDARTPNVVGDETYLKGWFEVQDQGSQIVAALAGARPGEQVLDFCAGAGGKSLALAAAMGNKGQIFAYDSDRARLAPIHERLKRNGVHNVQVRMPQPGALDDLVGRMDRVVIDAPCTGTGTWRRRPDTKWTLTPELLAQRVEAQQAVLAQGRLYLRPGGTLIYITCSILPEENDDRIAAFIAANPGFAPVPPGDLWQATFASPMPPELETA